MLDRTVSSDESGFVLIFVLILSVALITMLTFAVSSSVGNLNNAANYSNVNQAQNSAMSGLSAATNAMTIAGSITNLPCTWSSASGVGAAPMLLPSVQNTSDGYNVVITYSAGGVADPCTTGGSSPGPATTPDAAVLVSTGTTPNAHAVVMQETMTIAATPASLLAPFTFAMFSQQTLALSQKLNVNSPSTCIGPNGVVETTPCANVYGNVVNNCQNQAFIQGTVQVGSQLIAALTLGNQCEVTGDLYVSGDVTLKNGATVDGSVHAYGGNVTLDDSASVVGSIFATTLGDGTRGTIAINTNGINQFLCLLLGCDSVGGSLWAAAAAPNGITATIGGIVRTVISGLPLLQVGGSVNMGVANSSMPAAPASQSLPQLNPSALTLSLSAGDSATPTPHLYNVICIGGTNDPGCASYQPSCSTFQATATVTYSTPTALYAPTCTVVTNGSTTFNLGSNEIWVVKGFSNGGSLTVQASVSTNSYDLGVVVSATLAICPLADISLNGNTNLFAASVKVALFTPCNVNINGNQTINGQILAGENITSTGNVTINYDQSGSKYLPGSSGSPVPTPSVTGKTVTNG
jgi:hypothetical protein